MTTPLREVDLGRLSDRDRIGPCIVTVGTFDGMHRGHAEVIARTVSVARRARLPSVMLAFDSHPADRLRAQELRPSLTTIARRAELAGQWGIDVFGVLPFELSAAYLGPVDFVREVLVERLGASGVVAGANSRLDHGASGSSATMEQLADQFGMTLSVVDLVRVDGQETVSATATSTLVRSAVDRGDLVLAGSALGRAYRIDGLCEPGGASTGWLRPSVVTLTVDHGFAVPPDGVFDGRVVRLDESGRTRRGSLGPATIYVGTRASASGQSRLVEVDLLDRRQLVTGGRLGVEFEDHFRDVGTLQGPSVLASPI